MHPDRHPADAPRRHAHRAPGAPRDPRAPRGRRWYPGAPLVALLLAAPLAVGCEDEIPLGRNAVGGDGDAGRDAGDAVGRDGGSGVSFGPVCAAEVVATGNDWVVLTSAAEAHGGPAAEVIAFGVDGARVASHRFLEGVPLPFGAVTTPRVPFQDAPGSAVVVEVATAGDVRGNCPDVDCVTEVAVFDGTGLRDVWRSPPGPSEGQVTWALPDGRFVFVRDEAGGLTARLVDAGAGTEVTLDEAPYWVSGTPTSAGWHAALVDAAPDLPPGELSLVYLRPSDGSVAPVPDAPGLPGVGVARRRVTGDGRWVFPETSGDGPSEVVVAGPDGTDRFPLAGSYDELQVDVVGSRAVVMESVNAASLARRPVALLDLVTGARTDVPASLLASLPLDGTVTRTVGEWALARVDRVPVARASLADLTIEAVPWEAVAPRGAAVLPDEASLPGILPDGRLSLALRSPEPGWFSQERLGSPLVPVGRPFWRADVVTASLVQGTWWISQQERPGSVWDGAAPPDAVVGDAYRFIRDGSEMALTTGLGEGFAIPTAGGRCGFVFDLRPGTSSPAVSLFDVVNPYPLLRLEGAWGYLSLGLP